MVAVSLPAEHPTHWRMAVIVAAALLLAAAAPVAAVNPNGQNTFTVQVLQSNNTDADLVNGWGITAGPPGPNATPWWVSDNGTDKTTLYRGDGTKVPLTFGVAGGPTGTVFNIGLRGFTVTGSGGTGTSRFIFATEGGQVLGWASPAATPDAVPGFTATDGAIYKGLAIADDANGLHLFVADFHNAKIDVLDDTFTPVTLAGSFVDPGIPAGFAPFGIQNLNGHIFVAYAKQDADAEDEIAGGGQGFVSMFGTDGTFQGRVFSGGMLNAPWGLAWAPANFGKFSGDLLVGNFGNGRINAFAPTPGGWVAVGPVKGADHRPITIDGLWGIGFGNGGASGPTNVLYFAAGPADETEGLFGSISPPPGS